MSDIPVFKLDEMRNTGQASEQYIQEAKGNECRACNASEQFASLRRGFSDEYHQSIVIRGADKKKYLLCITDTYPHGRHSLLTRTQRISWRHSGSTH